MSSTTSCFIPAAPRAGSPAYSPETSTARPGDTGETRAFEDLVPEDRGSDTRATERELSDPADAAKEPVATNAEDVADGHDDDEDERDERPSTSDGAAIAALATPSLLQTLLNTAAQQAAAVAPTAPGTSPAENAATASAPADGVTSQSTRDGPATASPNPSAPVNPAAAPKASRATPGPQPQAQEAKAVTPGTQTGVAAASGRTSSTAAPTAVEATAETPANTSRTALSPSDAEPAAHPPVTRLVHTRSQGEKSAGSPSVALQAQAVSGQNRLFSADQQQVTSSPRSHGTRSAIPAATMSSSTTNTAQRRSEGSVLTSDSQAATGWTSAFSVDWKGWTNGGGERASTAAQFSQLGDKLSQTVLAAAPASAPIARAAVSAPQSAAPTAPAAPVEVAEALVPIHSAIERLVLHGREQLSLTVRFEQGGSLSIKLAMNQGEIATQIQTDVPGLEAALKGAWGELAQDWNGRGWKLANPDISSSTPTYHSRHDASADARQGQRQARQQGDDLPETGGRGFSPARARSAAPAVTLSGVDALRAAALSRRGIHTWA